MKVFPKTIVVFLIILLFSCGKEDNNSTAPNSNSHYDILPLFSDEFDGSTLDLSKWTIDKEKYRTDEVQCYTIDAKNVKVVDGNLQLIAVKENSKYTCVTASKTDLRDYTSGSIRTLEGISNLGYGKYEARIKVPIGFGYFTAFWTLGFGGGWPGNGEVDIMESVGQYSGTGSNRKLEDFVRGTAHWINGSGSNESNPRMLSQTLDMTQYHVFKVERLPTSIKWFVDDIEYASLDITDKKNGTDELHTNHVILLNFALGGWPPSPDTSTSFPAIMHIDYVRYYKYKP